MLTSADGNLFACSRTAYLDQYAGLPETRIYIPVKFGNLHRSFAVVDTGAPWCILSREEAMVLDPDYSGMATEETSLTIRGLSTSGVLVRWPITLCAEEGNDIEVEGTVFVPNEDMTIPNFIGLEGLLCRIRFAVDPEDNQFFFGPM